MYKKVKYVVLGAGPSGLAIANGLISQGVNQSEILVLEKEPSVGGLCRSELVDGAPLDTGGGHFLDVRRQNVLDFLFKFLPREEWQLFNRIAKIRLRASEIDHPLEANLFQLSVKDQVNFLESIAQAGCVCGDTEPDTFEKWIYWKFGDLISNDYMLPYNKKIWSMNLDELGIYWLHKLPNVSFRETLESCLERSPMGTLPAHGTFLYPKNYGYGEVWRRMGQSLGKSLLLNYDLKSLDIKRHLINDEFEYQHLITTIPWSSWQLFSEVPPVIAASIEELKYSSIDVDYHHNSLENSAHWIYEPNPDISFHRILLRSNFIGSANGYWTETNSKRSPKLTDGGVRFSNEFAYPINTINKPASISRILSWADSNLIHGLGRWGCWEHMNSDVAVDQALSLAIRLTNAK